MPADGAPGLGKTLLVRTLAGALDLQGRRIQFTPDLMPADITGTEILEEDIQTGRRQFRFNPGPVFTNMLLADEINRTPPKTQAALLEAMQERCVTAAGETRPLPQPFLVLATQNPSSSRGLPAARGAARRHVRDPALSDVAKRSASCGTCRPTPLTVLAADSCFQRWCGSPVTSTCSVSAVLARASARVPEACPTSSAHVRGGRSRAASAAPGGKATGHGGGHARATTCGLRAAGLRPHFRSFARLRELRPFDH